MSRYDDIDLGPVILTYAFPDGQKLPNIGTVVKDDVCSMEVIGQDIEKNTITVELTVKDTLASKVDQYTNEMDKVVTDIAELVYKHNSKGMTALIGWEGLPEQERERHLTTSRSILKHLNDNKLLILDYDPYKD